MALSCITEYNKLEGLLNEKKDVKKAYVDSKKEYDVLNVATSLLKDSGIKQNHCTHQSKTALTKDVPDC